MSTISRINPSQATAVPFSAIDDVDMPKDILDIFRKNHWSLEALPTVRITNFKGLIETSPVLSESDMNGPVTRFLYSLESKECWGLGFLIYSRKRVAEASKKYFVTIYGTETPNHPISFRGSISDTSLPNKLKERHLTEYPHHITDSCDLCPRCTKTWCSTAYLEGRFLEPILKGEDPDFQIGEDPGFRLPTLPTPEEPDTSSNSYFGWICQKVSSFFQCFMSCFFRRSVNS